MRYVGNIIYDEILIDTQAKFVIFGAGGVGKKIYEFLTSTSGQIAFYVFVTVIVCCGIQSIRELKLTILKELCKNIQNAIF